MLATRAMSELEYRVVSTVERRPWTPPARLAVSGSKFEQVASYGPGGERRRYILKRITPRTDLVMNLTGDDACRERLAWQSGLIDNLPVEVYSPIVASCHDGDGWALLMVDVTESLLVTTNRHFGKWLPFESDLAYFMIGALASLHAHYFESSALQGPLSVFKCNALAYFTCLSPNAAERTAQRNHPLVQQIRDGWELLERLVPADLARAVRELQRDTRPFCDALMRYPVTLAHGDARADNLALVRGDALRLGLLDWQFVGVLPPAVDVLWFINGSVAAMPITRDAIVEHYRSELARRLGARFDVAWWHPQLELAMLGQFLRCGGWLLSSLVSDSPPFPKAELQEGLDWMIAGARLGLERI